MSTVEYTVWKFKNFPSSQILREINFDKSQTLKTINMTLLDNSKLQYLISRKICLAKNSKIFTL